MQAYDRELALAKRLGINRETPEGQKAFDAICAEFRSYSETIFSNKDREVIIRESRRSHLSMACSSAGHEHVCSSCKFPMNVGIGFRTGDEMYPMDGKKLSEEDIRKFYLQNRPTICQPCLLLAFEMLVTMDNWTSSVRSDLMKAEQRYNRFRDPEKDKHWDELPPEQRLRYAKEPPGNAEPEESFDVVRGVDEGGYEHVITKGNKRTLCGSEDNMTEMKILYVASVDSVVLLARKPGARPFCATCRHEYLELRRITP